MKFENEYMEQRHANREKIAALGVDPFPGKCTRDHRIDEVLKAHGETERESLEANRIEVALVGRLMLRRDMGKASFAHIEDGGGRIQVYLRKDDLSEQGFSIWKAMDLGDFMGVKGFLFRTRKDELTVHVTDLQFLSKAYRGVPEKYHGLQDTETRYRQRYLDLIANPEVKNTFVTRGRIIQAIRNFMFKRDYLEVETPMMQPIPGGATARPFVTHHNTLDMDLYLRIAPELYLKRLIVGGIERVFEINRNFRNEGISTQHNPEFTMMEWYEAYANLDVMREMLESMIKYAIDEVIGTRKITYLEHTLDFESPFACYTMKEAVCKFGDYKPEELDDEASLRRIGKALNVEDADKMETGRLLTEIFELVAEPHLIQPTFILEYPVSVSPLTKFVPGSDSFVQRFEFYIAGMELANAYTELNDPIDQRERFMDQLKQREAGDDEAQLLDEDFLTSMEHGMPPTGGQGLGIDRLVMVLTNSASIRDVILFPLMRGQSHSAS